MAKQKYITDPKEVYALELKKLQLYFSKAQEVGENASEILNIKWRHVEHLRQLNFLIEQALMVGDAMLSITS